jgi:hypothetical protein
MRSCPRSHKLYFLNAVMSACFLLFPFTTSAINYFSVASGNWTTPATWAPAGVPGVGDNVTIQFGHTITMSGNPGSCRSLTLNGTALWTQARTTNVGGGGITISATGDVTGTVAGVLTSTGGLTLNAILTSNTVTIRLQNSNQNINLQTPTIPATSRYGQRSAEMERWSTWPTPRLPLGAPSRIICLTRPLPRIRLPIMALRTRP